MEVEPPLQQKKITVESDATAECDTKLATLTGDCLPSGRCWTFSHAAGAVKVGPTYDDFSWFTSGQNGLQDTQYDDAFCFSFNGLTFENKNNGMSVNPWNGYLPENYNGGVSSFTYSVGTGKNSSDQIIIPDDQFMGVWDADNVMDVVKLTSSELVVKTRLRANNGVPAAEGWFQLTFVPK